MPKKYKILVVEDEELAADRMEMLIDKLGHDCLGCVDNSTDALATLKQQIPDLILMDINIRGAYDGIELTDLIHAQHPIPVLFVSSLHDEQTFQRIARTNPIAYIIKPFSDIQLQRTIELVFKQQRVDKEAEFQIEISPNSTDYFFIKKGKILEKISRAEILYLEADGRYSIIHLDQQKKYLVRLPLKELYLLLNQQSFIPVHRSYIVCEDKIDRVDLEDYTIQVGNHTIPLSRREKDSVLERLRLL